MAHIRIEKRTGVQLKDINSGEFFRFDDRDSAYVVFQNSGGDIGYINLATGHLDWAAEELGGAAAVVRLELQKVEFTET